MKKPLKIIDLFAGPGGLGEGFSAFKDDNGKHPFRISLSVEKEASAHKTLQLRAFYRQFPEGEVPQIYYDFLAGKHGKDPAFLYRETAYRREAEAAVKEARQFTLGVDNRKINSTIEKALGANPAPWVLIGGPPCQAYSVVGRARNRGIVGYDAQQDHRNFLYKEYLKVIARFQPAVFVMENVKGLLSAKVGDTYIFDEIRRDLQCPARALATNDRRQEYTIFSLTTSSLQSDDLFNTHLDPGDFVIRSEQYGVPQTRHRVILLGIQRDIAARVSPGILKPTPAPSIQDVIGDLPALRSGLSKQEDSYHLWATAISADIDQILSQVRKHGLSEVADRISMSVEMIGNRKLERGSNWNHSSTAGIRNSAELGEWYRDPSGWNGICNHETRGHIVSDLHRYLFCACFGQGAKGNTRSTPKADEFPEALAPSHVNWKSGHFADRFRVQAANRIATTVTSHISKDGHYFIHYDPTQCRSLTVREAARIQTFPDNYFFVGNRTQQYVQVGNAVPPFLASKIARIAYDALTKE